MWSCSTYIGVCNTTGHFLFYTMGKATRAEGQKPHHIAREKPMTTLPSSRLLMSHCSRHNWKGPKTLVIIKLWAEKIKVTRVNKETRRKVESKVLRTKNPTKARPADHEARKKTLEWIPNVKPRRESQGPGSKSPHPKYKARPANK
jgi:hypothetical protein